MGFEVSFLIGRRILEVFRLKRCTYPRILPTRSMKPE
jgi:hypothetical protein